MFIWQDSFDAREEYLLWSLYYLPGVVTPELAFIVIIVLFTGGGNSRA